MVRENFELATATNGSEPSIKYYANPRRWSSPSVWVSTLSSGSLAKWTFASGVVASYLEIYVSYLIDTRMAPYIAASARLVAGLADSPVAASFPEEQS
jgi:hypothetical protein